MRKRFSELCRLQVKDEKIHVSKDDEGIALTSNWDLDRIVLSAWLGPVLRREIDTASTLIGKAGSDVHVDLSPTVTVLYRTAESLETALTEGSPSTLARDLVELAKDIENRAPNERLDEQPDQPTRTLLRRLAARIEGLQEAP